MKYKRHILLFPIVTFLLLIVFSCKYLPEDSQERGTGGITAKLVWIQDIESINKSEMTLPEYSSIPTTVKTIRGVVSGSNMTTIQKDNDVSDGKGKIDNIPAGSNRTLTLQGLDSADVIIYQGEISSITITAGQTADAGTIVMGPVAYSVDSISNGGWGICAIISSGVTCWGDSPTKSGNQNSAIKVASSWGGGHMCILSIDKSISCYSNDLDGLIGGIDSAIDITAGGLTDPHFCSVLESGKVACWGNGKDGQLGNGKDSTTNGTNYSESLPVEVKDINTATKVSAGQNHVCAILSDGKVKCWGAGISIPYEIENIEPAIHISAGPNNTCIVVSSGKILCWQIGGAPQEIYGIDSAIEVAMGNSTFAAHACALLESGKIVCWGNGDYGQLGNGLFLNQGTIVNGSPVEVKNITSAKGLGVSSFNSCAIENQEIKCWGRGEYYLGNGDFYDSPIPVVIISETSTTENNL